MRIRTREFWQLFIRSWKETLLDFSQFVGKIVAVVLLLCSAVVAVTMVLALPFAVGAYVEFGIVPWEQTPKSKGVTLSNWWVAVWGVWILSLFTGGMAFADAWSKMSTDE